MKIVYLIGNGFDLAQNLRTKYSHFYDECILKKELSNDILVKLQKSIKSDIPSWADMEKRLGDFTSEMSTVQDVDDVYDFLKQELKNYLINEQNKFAISSTRTLLFQKRLTVPEISLPPESADAIKKHINGLTAGDKKCDISVISFNYTDVFERAVAYNNKPVELVKREGDIAIKLNSISKVHGAVDREMVMGVADPEQIANKQLASDIDALDVLVKPRTTSLRRDFVCNRCVNLIGQADIIVMYGLSIGETDRNWWKLVTDRIYSHQSTRLIIYGHLDDTIDPNDYPRIRREERKLYKKLYECNGTKNLQFTRMDKQIFISFNDELFHV